MFAEHAEHAVVGSQAIGCRGPGGHKVRLMSSPRPLVNRGPKWSGPGPPLYGLFIQNLFKVLLEGQKSILARPPRASHAYTSHLPPQAVVLLVGGEICMAAPAVSTLRSSLCQRGRCAGINGGLGAGGPIEISAFGNLTLPKRKGPR